MVVRDGKVEEQRLSFSFGFFSKFDENKKKEKKASRLDINSLFLTSRPRRHDPLPLEPQVAGLAGDA
jgi:hypothetical protein